MVNLHIRADLRCLKVFIRGQKARISEISIEGMEVLWHLLLHNLEGIKFSPYALYFCAYCLCCHCFINHKQCCMSTVSHELTPTTSLLLPKGLYLQGWHDETFLICSSHVLHLESMWVSARSKRNVSHCLIIIQVWFLRFWWGRRRWRFWPIWRALWSWTATKMHFTRRYNQQVAFL